MRTDLQESPKEYGRYAISDDGKLWAPAVYDPAADQWTQYSLFSSRPDGYDVVDHPKHWITNDELIKRLGL